MSTAVAAKTHYTPEDLLAMPDGKSYELVGGQLEERNMGVESSWVGSRVVSRLDRFCEEHKSGWALQADCGYQCFPHDPGMVRRADASFVKTGRFPGNVLPKGWAKVPPDLVVEVTPVWDQRMAAFDAFGSQFTDPSLPPTRISDPAFRRGVEGRAMHWGSLIGVTWAEALWTAKPVPPALLAFLAGLA